MTASEISTLRTAEDAATAAQKRLANLHAAERAIFEAMVCAGTLRAVEMLDPEDMKLFGYEVMAETAAKAARLAMDDLVMRAADDAGKANDLVDELTVEADEIMTSGGFCHCPACGSVTKASSLITRAQS